MQFLYPALFIGWAVLAVVPVILYLFRPRPRTVRTSTLPFFKWLAKEHQDAAWLKWLKHLLSLLLSILVILAAAAALGRLVSTPSDHSLNTVIILVDRSASMATTDAHGATRLEAGLKRVDEQLAGLSAGVGVVVMAYDKRPEVLLARTTEPRQVKRALQSIKIRPIEGDYQAAWRLTRRLAELETPTAIWHVTDRPPDRITRISDETGESRERESDETAEMDAPAGDDPTLLTLTSTSGENAADKELSDKRITVEHIDVAISNPINVGITSFDMRRLPFQRGRFEAFVQVSAAAESPIDVELEVTTDDALIAVRKLTVDPDGRKTLLIPVDAGEEADKTLELVAKTDGDVFPSDDAIYVRVPQLRPIQVLWISEDPNPFMELALSTLGADDDAVISKGAPSDWPPQEKFDAVIFDGWLPETWPTDLSAIIIDPPGKIGPVQSVRLDGVGLPVDSLRATDDTHPLLYGVASGRIAIMQTVVLEANGPLQPVWVGPQGPLLLAGEISGQRVVVFGFSPQMSENLPLMASFPLLIGNAVYWSAEEELESIRGMNRRTGTLVPLKGKSINWNAPRATEQPETMALQSDYVELDRIGLWETDAGEAGSAALLSVDETHLVRGGQKQNDLVEAHSSWWLRGDLLPLFLWMIVLILVVESLLFHRYLAY